MNELKKTKDGEVFIDRDGKTFEALINYLRSDRKVFPSFQTKQEETMFFKELHHWNIDREHREWQEQYLNKFDTSHIREQSMISAEQQSFIYPYPVHVYKKEKKDVIQMKNDDS